MLRGFEVYISYMEIISDEELFDSNSHTYSPYIFHLSTFLHQSTSGTESTSQHRIRLKLGADWNPPFPDPVPLIIS